MRFFFLSVYLRYCKLQKKEKEKEKLMHCNYSTNIAYHGGKSDIALVLSDIIDTSELYYVLRKRISVILIFFFFFPTLFF